jgi:hypothetical protein
VLSTYLALPQSGSAHFGAGRLAGWLDRTPAAPILPILSFDKLG